MQTTTVVYPVRLDGIMVCLHAVAKLKINLISKMQFLKNNFTF